MAARIEEYGAGFEIGVLQSLLETDSEELCKEILNQSVPYLKESIKKELKSNLKHSGESELVNSIKAGKAKKTKDGSTYIINVSPKGYSSTKVYNDKRTPGNLRKNRKQKVPNALKAIWKEYGIPGKQSPSPFFAPATRKAEKQVIAKMQKTYERKAGMK